MHPRCIAVANCAALHTLASCLTGLDWWSQAQQLCHKVSAAFRQTPVLDNLIADNTDSWGTDQHVLSIHSTEHANSLPSLKADVPTGSGSMTSVCSQPLHPHLSHDTTEGKWRATVKISDQGFISLAQLVRDGHLHRACSSGDGLTSTDCSRAMTQIQRAVGVTGRLAIRTGQHTPRPPGAQDAQTLFMMCSLATSTAFLRASLHHAQLGMSWR